MSKCSLRFCTTQHYDRVYCLVVAVDVFDISNITEILDDAC